MHKLKFLHIAKLNKYTMQFYSMDQNYLYYHSPSMLFLSFKMFHDS